MAIRAVNAMPGVIGRYLFFEVARVWLVVAAVLLFLTLGLGFSRFIAEAAAGNLPVNTVLLLAMYSAIENAGIVLPISVLLAVLLTLGRLSRDNELVVMLAGGAGLLQLYRPFLVLAVIVALLASGLSLFAAPHAKRVMDGLTDETMALALQTLAPGQFRTLLNGNAVFYAKQRSAEDGSLEDVFIRVQHVNREGELTQSVATAERALQRSEPATGAQLLVLQDGWRYEGLPGTADYRIVRFEEHGMRVLPDQDKSAVEDVKTKPTAALLGNAQPAAAAEFQARLAVPISILLLTLVGLPLGRVPPRAGRYGRIVSGVLLYAIYFNLVHLAKIWVQTETIPAALGIWVVHLGMLILAIFLIMRERGMFMRRKRKSAA
ncbi:MAG TPA: LPS export ABC transporter permease LptF [Salinisphaeraceae bacterium]|nr:LPS export ABC transporter permease LptF [Salinisphaeraceae bacterium]